MAKFGLGKGLADLETEAGASPEISTLAGMADRVVVRSLPLSQIGANPDQPRKRFAPDELSDLAQSIREHGVLQPIIVRTVTGMPHLYEIVAGERRWRASELAGRTTIPALVKPLSPENAMEIALIENVQRENLNAIEECDAYHTIMTKCNYSMADLSNLIGKSESYIRNITRLAKLPEKVKELVRDGELSASHARALAVAENPEKLAEDIISKELSVAEVTEIVRSGPRSGGARRNNRARAKEYPAESLRKAEREIEDAIGVRAHFSVKASGGGTLTLSFKNVTEMEMLAELLKQGK